MAIKNLFFNIPSCIGVSGQRSRTSNTKGAFFILEHMIAGIAMERGVLEAKTTSAGILFKTTIKQAYNVNNTKQAIRNGKNSL